jgi:hypothetical protein
VETSPLAGWDNFYVIVGGAAGGLTGLTFVVIALVRDVLTARPVKPTGLRAYVTPTIVHFGCVLALAAYMSMPHQKILTLSLGLAVLGVAGLVYCSIIVVNLRDHGASYVPVREDWIFNVILPYIVYLSLLAAAYWIWREPAEALYAVAVVTLILLFIGIRNAWDIAVWMTMTDRDKPQS